MRYTVRLNLEVEYYDIEADCEEEAVKIAKKMAIEDDEMWYHVEEQEEMPIEDDGVWYYVEEQEDEE